MLATNYTKYFSRMFLFTCMQSSLVLYCCSDDEMQMGDNAVFSENE